LKEFVALLQPFAKQTDALQTDGKSLSLIIPALLDIEAHLQKFPAKTVARALQQDFRKRFACFLEPMTDGFNPVPSAATLMDPAVAGSITCYLIK
jgi:hypothetical protein